jgi:hypothetical protein
MNNKDYKMVSVKISTHDALKALAGERGVTIANFVDDLISNDRMDDSTGNVFRKLSRIEEHLKKLDSSYHLIYTVLVRMSNANGVPLVPFDVEATDYKTDGDLKTESEHLDDLRKLSEQDEIDRKAAISAGEDIPERNSRRKNRQNG